jgi:hypothetical protein
MDRVPALRNKWPNIAKGILRPELGKISPSNEDGHKNWWIPSEAEPEKYFNHECTYADKRRAM